MKILATFDAMNYQATTALVEKYSVRGIIMRGGKLAMQCSRDGEYKLPGGGIEPGEDFVHALIREVHEETGLHVIASEVSELGEIVEIRRDLFDATTKYICHSLFYGCKVDDRRDGLRLTKSEAAKGYELRWATPEEVCRGNAARKEPWIVRDTAFVKMIMEGKIALQK